MARSSSRIDALHAVSPDRTGIASLPVDSRKTGAVTPALALRDRRRGPLRRGWTQRAFRVLVVLLEVAITVPDRRSSAGGSWLRASRYAVGPARRRRTRQTVQPANRPFVSFAKPRRRSAPCPFAATTPAGKRRSSRCARSALPSRAQRVPFEASRLARMPTIREPRNAPSAARPTSGKMCATPR